MKLFLDPYSILGEPPCFMCRPCYPKISGKVPIFIMLSKLCLTNRGSPSTVLRIGGVLATAFLTRDQTFLCLLPKT
jgi:hypothetical protein